MLNNLIVVEASLVTIDPNGDIILELSRLDGKVHLLVSSSCLILASPVFATMLSSPFKEGTSNHSGSGNRSPILLPEDDPEAFTLLCNVIHHKTDDVPRNLALPCLKNLAIICDKYDCAGVLVAWAPLWFQAYFKSTVSKDYNSLLFVAYVLDLPDHFSDFSWEILKGQVGPFIDLPGLNDHALICHNLVGK
jgi:hypothetical protein